MLKDLRILRISALLAVALGVIPNAFGALGLFVKGANILIISVQQVLDYRDLDYRDPRNTGIYKKFHSSITAIFLLIHPRNTRIFRMPL